MRANLTQWFNYRRDFSVRLGLSVGAIILGSALVLSVALVITLRSFWSDARGQAFAELAYHMADKLDRGMFERYREIVQLGEHVASDRTDLRPDELREHLESIQETYPYYAWLGFANVEGSVIAATHGILENVSVSARPWFTEAQTAPYIGDVHDAVLLAPFLSTGDGSPVRLVDLSTPMYSADGDLIGILGAHLSWDWVEEVRESILEPLRNRSLVETTVIGQSGTILLSRFPEMFGILWNLAEIPPDSGMGFVLGTEENMPILVGYARTEGLSAYPGLGWTVIVSQPFEIALESAHGLGLKVLIVFVVFASLIAFVAFLNVRLMLRPIVALAAAADRIRPDDPEANLPIISGKDEIASLSHSLHTMFSAQKAYQEEIKRYSTELEQRVSDRTAEIELLLGTTRDALERERALNMLKARLTSLINHEFRTPLAVILSSASMMQVYEDRMTSEKKREHLKRIEANVNDLDALLDEVMTLSRTETIPNQMPRVPVDITAMAQEVINEFQNTTERHTILLSTEGDPRLIAVHEKLLKHAITNLVSNALKYSPNGGTVRVRVSYGEMLEISVEDQGIGIEEDDIARLYQPFFRGKNAAGIKGTGLGMVIVKQAVDAHCGTITLTSQIGIGSTFVISIPMT